MAEIIKVYKEHLPALRFIGKRYTDADRGPSGGFDQWGEWFEKDWFAPLEKLGKAENIENGYLGFMRCQPDFEYWIGMFLLPNTAVPDGYAFIDMDEGDIGVCWIKGKHEDGSIYWMHDKCLESWQENGMSNYRKAADGRSYFFERYIAPRFMEKDELGDVILDYGIYLA